MVHLRTVPTAFHAGVIAARLGAEGIVTEMRGNTGGPYPIGDVSLWVQDDQAELASELLLADEVEAAFSPAPDGDEPRGPRRVLFGLTTRQILAACGLMLLLWATFMSRLVP